MTTIDAATKFRKMPALTHCTKWDDVKQAWVDSGTSPAGQEMACQLRSGHVLQVHGDRIVCRECGATWKSEGF